ncbi:MAG: ABC transporter permease [Armatimonadetes bacterium]|nr:ABC transporter permease [Armatimonadota bacterium]
MATWLKESVGGYFDNPVATRDLRVHFRNGRIVILLVLYALFVSLMAQLSIGNIQSYPGSIASAQRELVTAYFSLTGLIFGLVSLVSAMSAAFSVVSERQRKAMDLVFSAPFSARRYVLGKVISGVRYSAILIAMSLPAMAALVVAGGATTLDVLLHCALILASSTFFTAVGVAFASYAKNFIAPLAMTLVVAFVWSVTLLTLSQSLRVVSSISAPSVVPTAFPFVSCLGLLTPGLGAVSPTQPVQVYGFTTQAWIPALVVVLLAIRFAIVAATTGLEFPIGKAARTLRVHGLVYVFVLGLIIAAAIVPPTSSFGDMYQYSQLASRIFAPVLITTLYTAPFGSDRMNQPPDRTAFTFKKILWPYSTNALAYGLLLCAAWWVPFLALASHARNGIGLTFIFHSCLITGFFVALLRCYSHLTKTTEKAKGFLVLTLLFMVALSVGFAGDGTALRLVQEGSFSVYDLALIRPWLGYTQDSFNFLPVHLILLSVATATLFYAAEKRSRRG